MTRDDGTRRIRAMASACAGISTEALEAGAIGRLAQDLRWYQERLCEGIGECVGDFCGMLPDDDCAGCRAYTALTTIKGDAA